MTTWHQFLVEHAKFPFPCLDESRTVGTTHISVIEEQRIEESWRATHAVRGENLVRKLCDTLQDILADDVFPETYREPLLYCFAPKLGTLIPGDWQVNACEADASNLLEKGILNAASMYLGLYGSYNFNFRTQLQQPGTRSLVDFVGLLDNQTATVLCEAKSPSVMRHVGGTLPQEGVELKWNPRDSNVVRNVLNTAAQYLAVRELEWLFLTSHNHWIVCRLVRDHGRCFLVYSPNTSIKDSSEPFRALLGAILSVLKGVPVERNEFNPDLQFDLIEEHKDPDPLPEDDIEDQSGSYQGSSVEDV